MGRETDIWPFIQAKYFDKTPAGIHRLVRHVVVHDEEYPETVKSSEDIAAYFHSMPDGRVASAHVVIDSDSIIQCVHDNDIAYAAPPLNAHGIHLELAGFQRQTREQWLDDYGVKMFGLACNVIAQYCAKYMIVPMKLTDSQLHQGIPGIVGHDQVSRVFHQSTHSDPGPNFPWDYVMQRVTPLYVARLQAPTRNV